MPRVPLTNSANARHAVWQSILPPTNCNGRRNGLTRYSYYPIYQLTSVTADGETVAEANYELGGERNSRIDFTTAQADVEATGFFGYGRLISRGAIANGQTLAADATMFSDAIFGGTAPTVQAGSIFLIGTELMYHNGNGLVRGANGTTKAAYAPDTPEGIPVYQVRLPSIIEEATYVISQNLDRMRAMARDMDDETDTTTEDMRMARKKDTVLAMMAPSLMRYRKRGPLIGW